MDREVARKNRRKKKLKRKIKKVVYEILLFLNNYFSVIFKYVAFYCVVFLISFLFFYSRSEKKSFSSDTGVNVIQTYDDRYKLANNIDLIKHIRTNERWNSIDYEKKQEVVKAIINCEARYLGLSTKLNIEFKELDDEIRGQYDNLNKTITINSNILKAEDSLPAGILVTCLHETRHVYQHELCDLYKNVSPQQRDLFCFTSEGTSSWIENLSEYNLPDGTIRGDIDYYTQPMEKDARDWAYEQALIYYTEIDKMLEEDRLYAEEGN